MGITYNDIKIDGKTRFSPSGFSTFYENPQSWYKNNITKTGNFRGNTATVVGSIIHKRMENYWNNTPTNQEEEFNYIDLHKDNADVDEWKVADEVNRLWSMLQVEIPAMERPTNIEEAVIFEIPNTDYFIGGTYDYKRGDVLGDIKTTATTPKSIKVGHRIQLLLYALALKMSGVEVNYMEITYIVKLKKTPKVVVLKEPISEQDIEWIKQEVKNMIKRCDMVKADNELADIIFPNNPDSYIK